jgi:hypothetical protein
MPAVLPDIPATETLVIELTNKVRGREKLGSVKQDKALTAAARAYALYLSKTAAFSHTADGQQPAARASAAGYRLCQIAENLAQAENSDGFAAKELATQTLEGWLNSPGHRANLLAAHVTDIGVAVARVPGTYPKYVVVQMVGRPQALAAEFQVSNATKDLVTYALSGRSHVIKPGTGIKHTVCEPKTLEFRLAGKAALSGKYAAENGKVYTVTADGGRIRVDVKTRDTVR